MFWPETSPRIPMDNPTRRFNGPPGQEDMPYLLTPEEARVKSCTP